MQIKYKTLCKDNFGIEFKLISGLGANYIAQVGDVGSIRRIKKSYIFAKRCMDNLHEHALEPLSFDVSDSGIVSALYRQKDVAMLETFLNQANDLWQYIVGKRLGRVLYLLHHSPLVEKDKIRAQRRSERIIDTLALYLEKKHMRFENDSTLIEAISMRLGNMQHTKDVLILGLISLNNLFLSHDGIIVIKPTYNFSIGDYTEDLASLTNECAKNYPLFVSGAIDGYFGVNIPSKFYVNYALYSAINVITRGYNKVLSQKNRDLKLCREIYDNYVEKIDFLNFQFDDFKKPIPKFLLTNKLLKIRQQCLESGL